MSKQITACKHTDRKHGGNGLCHSCYVAKWIKEHPGCNSGPGWVKNNPERSRLYSRKRLLKKAYDITIEQYEQMWESQQGLCANPGCTFTAPKVMDDYRAGLGVDHNHTTGQVRALLCTGCNAALGNIAEDPKRLAGLVVYIERFK